MKKAFLIRLHVYCGLFISCYLVAFAVSAIVLNHRMNVENKTVKHTWEDQVQVDPALPDNQLAESVRDQLGIMGWPITWQFNRDTAHFKFQVTHLAKTYDLDLDLSSGQVGVGEIPKGFVATLHGLHFFNGRTPNASFFLKTWRVYQYLTLLVLLVSLILGIWLWIKYTYKTWELYVFGGLFILSTLIMILL